MGVVVNIIVSVGGSATTASANGSVAAGPGAMVGFVLAIIWGLGTIIPSITLVVRRLHDVNFSGWMILIRLVPILGSPALLIFMILPSKPEGQRFDVPA